MKKMLVIMVLILVLPTFAAAAAVKNDYQVTGPVLEVSDSKIVVQKGQDRWELARDKDTKVSDDLKVGDKVTIYYLMTATKVEVKGSKKAAAKETKKPGAKEETKPAVPAVR
jgi:ribosomal protein S1